MCAREKKKKGTNKYVPTTNIRRIEKNKCSRNLKFTSNHLYPRPGELHRVAKYVTGA